MTDETEVPVPTPVFPADGGSYIRNPDGTLTLVERPTAVPNFAPQE